MDHWQVSSIHDFFAVFAPQINWNEQRHRASHHNSERPQRLETGEGGNTRHQSVDTTAPTCAMTMPGSSVSASPHRRSRFSLVRAGAFDLFWLHVLVEAENNRGNLMRARDRPAAERCEARFRKFSTCRVEQSSNLWPMNNGGEKQVFLLQLRFRRRIKLDPKDPTTKLFLPSQMYRCFSCVLCFIYFRWRQGRQCSWNKHQPVQTDHGGYELQSPIEKNTASFWLKNLPYQIHRR